MRFRPCIDLHEGKVKQIVGSTLKDNGLVSTNFVSEKSPEYYASLYDDYGLRGGHVIMLGPGNEEAAAAALGAAPGTLQVGGGITPCNAADWLDKGASHVIVTSWLFDNGEMQPDRLQTLSNAIGKERLVVDLSCLPVDGKYHVACNRWQTICSCTLSPETFDMLANFCDELLVHAVGMEGKRGGIDIELIGKLAEWSPIPVTYAGGIGDYSDIVALEKAGDGKVDFTVGSALDIFGGSLSYSEIARCWP